MERKICTKCGKEKDRADFVKRKAAKDGLSSWCRECRNQNKREWSARNKGHCKSYMDSWREQNKEHVDDYRQKYVTENRDKVLESARRSEAKRRKNNPEAIRKINRESYHRNKKLNPRTLKTEEEKRLIAKKYMDEWKKQNSERLKGYASEYNAGRGKDVRKAWSSRNKHVIFARNSLHRSLRLTGRKKATRTENLLGYTYEQLRKRVECQFKHGMSWENYGEWHIDHVKPVSRFISQGVTEPRVINSLCNLRPLWAEENLRKQKSFHGNRAT